MPVSGSQPFDLTARWLVTPAGLLDHPCISLDADGAVTAIQGRSAQPNEPDQDPEPGHSADTLSPALFDIHTHGAAGHDVMEGSPAALDTIERFLATRGVAHYLPTTVSAPVDTTLRSLEHLSTRVDLPARPGLANAVGIHLEGPFLSSRKRGVHAEADLQPPDIRLFDRFWQASGGHIRLITVAPELPGALDLIRHAVAAGVIVSIGHTDATAEEARAAIAAGARSATHTFNAMRAMEQRAPGVLGTVLDDDRLFAELICDRVHVADELVRLWLKAKGPERAILVTDSMAASGMPDGHYRLGSLDVEVAHGRCLAGGVIAGSVLTLDRAVLNLHQITGAPIATSARLASANPANLLGLAAIPEIAIGRPAQICRFSPEGRLLSSWIHGALTHPAEL